MADELNLINKLSESRAALEELVVMQKLSQSRDVVLQGVCEIDNKLAEFQLTTLENYIRQYVRKLNTNASFYGAKGLVVTYDLSLNKKQFQIGSHVSKAWTELLDFNDLSYDEIFQWFRDNAKRFSEKTVELTRTFLKNRAEIILYMNNLKDTILPQYKEQAQALGIDLHCFHSCAIREREGIDRISINSDRYNSITDCAFSLDDLDEAKRVVDKLFAAMPEVLDSKYKKAFGKQHEEVAKFVRSVSNQISNREFSLKIVTDKSLPAYDLAKGFINVNFNLKDNKLRNQFATDVQIAKNVIYYYERSEFIPTPSPAFILGNKYFLYFKKEIEVDGVKYQIFDCRGESTKGILYVCQNGYKIKGKKRRAILKAAGF